MYGWAGLREQVQKIIRNCRKQWQEVVGIGIDAQGRISLVHLAYAQAWQLQGALQLPAEQAALADQAERISARLAREGWEKIPRVLVAAASQVRTYWISLPPDMPVTERREAVYWELESQLSEASLDIEAFQVASAEVAGKADMWAAVVNRAYIQEASEAFRQAGIPLTELVVPFPPDAPGCKGPQSAGQLAVAGWQLAWAKGAARCAVAAIEPAATAAVLFLRGLDEEALRAAWLLKRKETAEKWDYRRLAILLTGVCFLGESLLVGWDGWMLYQARAQAEARQQELAHLLPAKQQMETLEKRRSGLEQKEQRLQLLTQAGFPWYGLLVHLGAMTVDGVWLEEIEQRDEHGLEIEGRAVSYEAIADFVQVFERDKDFFPDGPVLESSGSRAAGDKQQKAAGTVDFRMALHL